MDSCEVIDGGRTGKKCTCCDSLMFARAISFFLKGCVILCLTLSEFLFFFVNFFFLSRPS